jgi:hypothetical protein
LATCVGLPSFVDSDRFGGTGFEHGSAMVLVFKYEWCGDLSWF